MADSPPTSLSANPDIHGQFDLNYLLGRVLDWLTFADNFSLWKKKS
jgi:hypothetical protein